MAAHYEGLQAKIRKLVSHYNHESYWRMRKYVLTYPTKLISKWYLFRIKRMDALNNASMGTHISFPSAEFATPPQLPHGLNGIVIAGGAKVQRLERIAVYFSR